VPNATNSMSEVNTMPTTFAEAECNVTNCDWPMTIFSIYCEKHDWIDAIHLERIEK
jgi:hypothetical protein